MQVRHFVAGCEVPRMYLLMQPCGWGGWNGGGWWCKAGWWDWRPGLGDGDVGVSVRGNLANGDYWFAVRGALKNV